MSNVIEEYSSLVEEINEKYNTLKYFSNDALREEVIKLKAIVENSNDRTQILNNILPLVYAIVKETARRFSSGNIEVTATVYDRRLAEEYDFVVIKENKAIYRNRWDVMGILHEWNMIHYDEQLLGGILLHYGYAIEMATGEGKTLVATLPTFLNALTKDGVHLMTVNDYLSKRDFELTRPLYMFYGLSVNCIECYPSNDYRYKEAYQCDITFGTTSSFTFDYLCDHLATKPQQCVQHKHNFAIIDELDSILIDEADTPHIVGGGNLYNEGQIYKDNIKFIRELIEHNNEEQQLYTVDTLHKTVAFTNKGKEWLRTKTGIEDLYVIERTYQVKDFEGLSKDKKTAISSNLKIQNVLYQLLRALTLYEKDVDYVLTDEWNMGDKNLQAVKIIDQHTGRIRERSRWEYGLHTAIEVKENVKVGNDFDGLAVISLKNYFRLYKKVAGMSGTIMPVENELWQHYGLKCTSLPTHKPMIREDKNLRIFRTTEEKDNAIINTIRINRDSGRPTLVGCLSIKRSDRIAELLTENGIKYNKLDAKNTKDEAITVSKAGEGNTITVSTSIAGRGTDIKPSDDAIANGGLMVIGTDLFDSVRIDRQLKGRSGRQGNPGSSVFFVSLEDMILNNLSVEDNDKLQQLVSELEGNDLSCPQVQYYFELAQRNSEEYFKEQRAEIARKDDIIAPHRTKFYNQRNSILFDSSCVNSIISEITKSDSSLKIAIESHLESLYTIVRELIKRTLSIHTDMRQIPVPFSCNLQPFAVVFDMDLVKFSLPYFINEFERHIILNTYDRLWKEFVLYMRSNLDKHEIEQLDLKYRLMMENITSDVLNLLQNSTVVFDPTVLPHTETEKSKIKKSTRSIIHISADAPCPCRSGKKYCECHGRDIRNRQKRRL